MNANKVKTRFLIALPPMSTTASQLNFPVKDLAEALYVLNPNTELDVFDNNLYVDLKDIRSEAFSRRILTLLGIVSNHYVGLTSGSTDKILLTGHRGTGKSVELEKIGRTLDQHYLVVTINIEKELIKLSSITPEDLYRLLIIKLFECLNESGIPYNQSALHDIAALWHTERETSSDDSNKKTLSAGVEGTTGFSAWIASLKAKLSIDVTSESKETTTTRQRIKANINEIISRLNAELAGIRLTLANRGKPGGVAFIIDGSEKIPYDVAQKIFVQDAPILQQINSAIIMASPVLGVHDINTGANYFKTEMFPMAKLDTAEKVAIFKQIVTRRVDEATFFEAGILDCIARKSGGGIRQMLELAGDVLLTKTGSKATNADLHESLRNKGLDLWRRLNGDHKAVLRSNTTDYDFGDETVRQMLFALVLLAQNGHAVINPLLEPYVHNHQNWGCA